MRGEWNWRLTAGVIVVGLVVVFGYLAFVPPESASPANEELYSALSSAGIEDAMVDVSEDRVLVRYELPPGYDLEATDYLVLGAAAASAPHTERLVVESYDGSMRLRRVTANTGDVLALISAEEPSPRDWERLRATLEVER